MTLQPKKEDLRKAVKWIGETRKYEPERPTHKLVEECALKFNLSPTDTEFLYRIIRGEVDINCQG
jgi:hypothetical protein